MKKGLEPLSCKAMTVVLNTMIVSVFERTSEIGILRAIGWRKSRIVRMILMESGLLSVARPRGAAPLTWHTARRSGAGVLLLATRRAAHGTWHRRAWPAQLGAGCELTV